MTCESNPKCLDPEEGGHFCLAIYFLSRNSMLNALNATNTSLEAVVLDEPLPVQSRGLFIFRTGKHALFVHKHERKRCTAN